MPNNPRPKLPDIRKPVLSSYEYEFLTNQWDGPKRGAAFNAVYDFCHDYGWCDVCGNITDRGRRAVADYEEAYKR